MRIFWFEFGVANTDNPYNPELDAAKVFKFVYWKDLAGEETVAACSYRKMGPIGEETVVTHSFIVKRVLLTLGLLHEPLIDGAGMVLKRGIDWTSFGYDVETPLELRPQIVEALGLQSKFIP